MSDWLSGDWLSTEIAYLFLLVMIVMALYTVHKELRSSAKILRLVFWLGLVMLIVMGLWR